MQARPMTRRSLLAGSAGALAAAALARPRGALAALAAPGEARVGELPIVDVSGGVGARRQAQSRTLTGLAGALPLANAGVAAAAGAPPIIARRVWARGVSPPRVAPGYGDVRLAFVHHTETPNGYAPGEVPAMLRGIYVFHRFIRGWNDIGYNFVVD